MKTILIKNALMIATFDDKNTRHEHADIYIEGPQIKEIGQNLQREADAVIDASGMIAIQIGRAHV